MVVRKRCLLWDYTNTQNNPSAIDDVDFNGPIQSVHNWNAWSPPELKGKAPFRPMVRTVDQASGQEWTFIEDSGEKIIHFLNEPERAGVSPEQAAKIWNEKMVPLRESKGKQLVSPSVASDAGGTAWLGKFMHLVHSSLPDYLGLHYYGTESAAAFKYLEEMHSTHPLPVIVSEFACISRDHETVERFTVETANWMDDTDWIVEYGFFGCMRHVADSFVSPAAQLMTADGKFTTLMHKLMTEQPMTISS